MKIVPLRKNSIFESAVDAIAEYIIANHLQEGDPLPPETELAERFNISRNIVREAIRHYRTLGIIESKPKVGPVIRKLLPDNPYAGYLPFLSANDNIFRQLAELRIAIESGAAEFIVKNIRPDQIAELKKICADGITADAEKAFQLDGDFHAALLESANNPLIAGLLPLLVHFFTALKPRSTGLANQELRPDVWIEHQNIIQAVEKADVNLLQELLRTHSQGYLA